MSASMSENECHNDHKMDDEKRDDNIIEQDNKGCSSGANGRRIAPGSPLSSKVALFNAVANQHQQKQSVNPFSNDTKVSSMPRPQFSKEDYGKPVKGSLSESRGLKAIEHVSKEMLELCEIINQYGEPLFSADEKADDPRIVISFGDLFSIYTLISDKLVGILLRARKHKILDFEGECLFQRRDDHVPVILLKPIKEIRRIFAEKIEAARAARRANEEQQQYLSVGGSSTPLTLSGRSSPAFSEN